MATTTTAELAPWRDPEDLMRSLINAGPGQLPELRDAVVRLLEHEDEFVREEAVRKLYVHWQDRVARNRVVELFQLDPDDSVRRTAAFGIASTSTSGTLVEDTKLLLDVLLDELQPLDVRGAAYEALLLIYEKRNFPPVKRDLDPAKDVDWEWINTLKAAGD